VTVPFPPDANARPVGPALHRSAAADGPRSSEQTKPQTGDDMTTWKTALAGAATLAITTTGLIGATATPANADDIKNTDADAKRLCKKGDDYDTVRIDKKRSLGANTDPSIGTLYVVELGVDKYCAITITGDRRDGKRHYLHMDLWWDDGQEHAAGMRRQKVGPIFTPDHEWVGAFGDLDVYRADLEA
jgi:hypothetical protein